MRLNISEAPEPVKIGHGIKVGHVYQNQQGRLYVVVAIHERDSCCGTNIIALVFDKCTGEILNAVSYGEGYFNRRPLVGTATNLPQCLDVDWV